MKFSSAINRLFLADLSIKDHPISNHGSSAKINYINGLFEAISLINNVDSKLEFCFSRFCATLKMQIPQIKVKRNCKYIKKALKLRFENWHFFRMSSYFWWDVFLLCYISNTKVTEEQLEVLRRANHIFSIKYFNASYDFFNTHKINKFLPKALLQSFVAWEQHIPDKIKQIFVMGTMSSGKSTLINSLVGSKLKAVKTTACTSTASMIYNNPYACGVTYHYGGAYLWREEPDLTLEESDVISLHFNSIFNNIPVIIIDSPGVNYAYEQAHREITQGIFNKSDFDILICVVNAPYLQCEDEMNTIKQALSTKCENIVFILNQYDRFDPADDSIKENIEIFKKLLSNNVSKSKISVIIEALKQFLNKNKNNANFIILPYSAKTAYLYKKVKNGKSLSKIEKADWEYLKRVMQDDFYDLAEYITHKRSPGEDIASRSGLTNFETIITSLIQQ